MNKLSSTARKIDTVFRIFDVMLKIALVAGLVSIGIIIVGTVLGLPDGMIGAVDQTISIGTLTLQVADGFMPAFDAMLLPAAVLLAMGSVMVFLGIRCVKIVRAILAPMQDGKPFDRAVSQNLRRLGWLSLILGAMFSVYEMVDVLWMASLHQLDTLLISDKITHVAVNAELDLSFLLLPAVLFLLAYVFRYGEQLQTLSDETL